MRVLKAVCCAMAIVVCLAPGARADEWNKKTYLTFSGPVQIPGATLPAGTYLFQLADPDNARHVIMVRDKDGTKIYSMFMTIPNERLDTPDNNVVMFAERPAGTPQAIQAWWYPGDRTGEEFVYPKTQALLIAKANRKSVLATETASTSGAEADRAAMNNAQIGRVDDSGQVVGQTTAPAAQNQPSTTAAPVAGRNAESSYGRNAEPTTAGTTGRRHLPRTAGELPLIELLSGLAFAGGLTVRQLRKR